MATKRDIYDNHKQSASAKIHHSLSWISSRKCCRREPGIKLLTNGTERRSLKKIRASAGFEPVTSAIPVRCSTNWANLLWWSFFTFIYNRSSHNIMNYFIYTSHHFTSHGMIWTPWIDLAPNVYRGGHGFESRWSPDFFQASSFQLRKLEYLLRWSFFTFINNRSSRINIFIYTSHHFTPHGRIWTQWIDLAPKVWLHSSVGRTSHQYRGGHGFESRWSPDFFRLLLSNCLNWKIYCDDHSSLS